MRASRLEIAIERGSGDLIVILLSGIFYKEGWSSLQEMILRLVKDGHRRIAIELQDVELRDAEIRDRFIEIINDMKGRGGQIVLISKREDVLQFFSSIRNLIDLYPTLSDYRHSGWIDTLRRQGVTFSKKTGIRLSAPMALLLIILIAGWFGALLVLITMQNDRIGKQQESLTFSENERLRMERELANLQQKLAPLTQLGLTSDSLQAADYQFTSDWIDHLEERFRKKQIAESLLALEATGENIPELSSSSSTRPRSRR